MIAILATKLASGRQRIPTKPEASINIIGHVPTKSQAFHRSGCPIMSFTRPILFWIAMLAAAKFCCRSSPAICLDPVANRIERLGMNRLVATLYPRESDFDAEEHYRRGENRREVNNGPVAFTSFDV
jgi:hypothetical protein